MNNKKAYVWVYGAVIFTAICLIIAKAAFDSDPIWSIEIGKYIFHNGIPHFDPFSWTVNGKPWMTPEWLFCIILAWLHGQTGDISYLVYILFCLISLGTVIYFIGKNEEATMFGYLMAAGVLLILYITGFAQPRAYLLALTFLVLTVYLIRINKIWYIPLIFVLWSNWHSSIIVGLIIVLTEALYRIYTTRKWDLAVVGTLAVLGSLLNPYGWKIYQYAVTNMLAVGTKYITEWKAPNFDDHALLLLYLGLGGFILLLQYYFFKKGYKHTPDGLIAGIWFWLFFIYALTTTRGIPFAILFFIPYMFFLSKYLVTTSYQKAPVFLALVLLLVGSSYLYISGYNWPPYQTAEWPNHAIVFLEDNPQYQDKLFNDYLWGALLIQKNIKPFIDARCDVYMENGVFNDYIKVEQLSIQPEKVFKKYGVNTVLIPKGASLYYYLHGRSGWELVYADNAAAVFNKE